jgi:hypothetical protein
MLLLCGENARFSKWPASDNNEPSLKRSDERVQGRTNSLSRSKKLMNQIDLNSHTVSATKNTKGCPGRPVLAYDIPVGNFWPDARDEMQPVKSFFL